MAYSADAQDTIDKLRRKIFDEDAHIGDSVLWGYICDAVDQVDMRTGVEVAYTTVAFASAPTSIQKEMYSSVAAVLMGFNTALSYKDESGYISRPGYKTIEEAINSIVNTSGSVIFEILS